MGEMMVGKEEAAIGLEAAMGQKTQPIHHLFGARQAGFHQRRGNIPVSPPTQMVAHSIAHAAQRI